MSQRQRGDDNQNKQGRLRLGKTETKYRQRTRVT